MMFRKSSGFFEIIYLPMSRTRAIVSDIRPLTPSILELTLRRTDGKSFPFFQAGQYATLSFPAYDRLKSERSFSIAGSAAYPTELQFGIRVGGDYTSTLRYLQRGDRAVIGGPFGQFTFDTQRDQSAVFIAGGIGITPFMSMIRTATDTKLTNELILIYSVRSLSDAAYLDELQALEKRNPNLRVIYVVSDGNIPKKSNSYFAGRVSSELIAAAVQQNPWGRSFFMCGPSAFMTFTSKLLKEMGLPLGMIRSERFAVGSSALIERGSPIPKFTFAAWGVATAVLLTMIVRVEQVKRATALGSAPTTTSATLPSAGTTAVTAPLVSTTPVVTPSVTTTPIVNTATPVNTSTTTPQNTAPAVTTTPTPVTQYVPTYQPRTHAS